MHPSYDPISHDDLLRRFGAGDDVLAALAGRTGLPGRIARVDRGRVTVLTPAGARAAAADPAVAPAVGDWVVLDGATVATTLPRRTWLGRRGASGRSEEQVLAAGIDLVLVVAALTGRWRPARVERMVALAWQSGAEPLVVLTKADLHMADLHADADARRREVATGNPGARVLAVSAPTGAGLDDLRGALGPGRTAALLGPSGVGKSTLLNALAGAEVAATGDVRDADGKGRHTTAWRELVVLPAGGAVIDTPGLRSVGMGLADDGVSRTFSDVEDLAADCRFGDCRHTGEPGCAVAVAVDAGLLDAARVQRHHKLAREVAYEARRTDARLRAEETRRWKAITKAQRARGHR